MLGTTDRARSTIDAELLALREGDGAGAHRGERLEDVATSFLGVVHSPDHRRRSHNVRRRVGGRTGSRYRPSGAGRGRWPICLVDSKHLRSHCDRVKAVVTL